MEVILASASQHFRVYPEHVEPDPKLMRFAEDNAHLLQALQQGLPHTLSKVSDFVEQASFYVKVSSELSQNVAKFAPWGKELVHYSVDMPKLNEGVNQQVVSKLVTLSKELQRAAKHDVYTFQLDALKDFKQVVDSAYAKYIRARMKLRATLDKYGENIDKAGDRLVKIIAKIYRAQFRYEKFYIGFLEELDEYCRIRHDYSVDVLEQTYYIQTTLFKNTFERSKKETPNNESTPTTPKAEDHPHVNLNHGPPTNLPGVLGNKLYLKAFKQFAESQSAAENVLFWEEAGKYAVYEEAGDVQAISALFMLLYKTYIATGSPLEINIDGILRDEVIEYAKRGEYPPFKLMSRVMDAVADMMRHYLLPIFMKSSYYVACHSPETLPKFGGLLAITLSFETFVKDPVGFEYFYYYASRNHNATEYLAFFQAVEKFQLTPDEADLTRAAQEIFNRFLLSSKKLLDVNQDLITKAMEQIQTAQIGRHMFDMLYTDVLSFLKTTILPKFHMIDLYRDLLTRNERISKLVNSYLEKEAKEVEFKLHRCHMDLTYKYSSHNTNSLLYNNNIPLCSLFFNYTGQSQPERLPSGLTSSTSSYSLSSVPSTSSFSSVSDERPELTSTNSSSTLTEKNFVVSSPSISAKTTQSDILLQVLSDPALFEKFKQFLTSEHQEENLMFWLATENFRKDETPTLQKAQQIFTSFIAKGASMEVNIDSEVYNYIKEKLDNNQIPASQLLYAQKQAFEAMRETVARFLKSKFYSEGAALSPTMSTPATNKFRSMQSISSTPNIFLSGAHRDEFVCLLTDPNGYEAFKQFATSEHQVENLLFWVAVENLKKTPPDQLGPQSMQIFSSFIEVGALMEVSIDTDVRDNIKCKLQKEEIPIEEFASAQKMVFEQMRGESFPRFLKSRFYADYKKASQPEETTTPTSKKKTSVLKKWLKN